MVAGISSKCCGPDLCGSYILTDKLWRFALLRRLHMILEQAEILTDSQRVIGYLETSTVSMNTKHEGQRS